MPHIQGIKGEAVRQRSLADCEPLITKKMGGAHGGPPLYGGRNGIPQGKQAFGGELI